MGSRSVMTSVKYPPVRFVLTRDGRNPLRFTVSNVFGVGHPANSTAFGNSDTLCAAAPALPLLSAAIGVGQPAN